ncbi:hypothetical protein D3C71_2106310 [compost metagenome]
MQQDGGTAKHADDQQADPLHRFHLAVAEAHPGNLEHRGNHRDGRGRIDAEQLEGDEEQDDRKQVEKKFHADDG